MEWSPNKINFLDITLHKSPNGMLWTDLYCKPRDSHSYLHYTSAHSSHCKRSLPFSQFLRVRRICHKTEDFLKHSMMLFSHFIRRGYPLPVIQKAFIKASTQSRAALLVKQRAKRTNEETLDPDQNNDLFLTTSFNLEFQELGNLVRKKLGLAQTLSSHQNRGGNQNSCRLYKTTQLEGYAGTSMCATN